MLLWKVCTSTVTSRQRMVTGQETTADLFSCSRVIQVILLFHYWNENHWYFDSSLIQPEGPVAVNNVHFPKINWIIWYHFWSLNIKYSNPIKQSFKCSSVLFHLRCLGLTQWAVPIFLIVTVNTIWILKTPTIVSKCVFVRSCHLFSCLFVFGFSRSSNHMPCG